VRLHDEFLKLTILMDVFTRSIRGWQLVRSLDQGLTLASERTLVVATPDLHHSDQGVRYAAAVYVERLRGLRLEFSMTSVGEPRENGCAERVIRSIKDEGVDLSEYRDFTDVRAQIGRFLHDVYNVKRIHLALGYLTPREFDEQWRSSGAATTTAGI
jgi:transposase InsO family protein